jgi:hypothetical protein
MSRAIPSILAVCMLVGIAGGCASSEQPQSTSASTPSSHASTSVPASMVPTSGDALDGSRPATAEVVAAAKRLVLENSAKVRIQSLTDIRMVRDHGGHWWVTAVGVPDVSENLESVDIFMYRVDKRWRLFDMGTDIDFSELPAEVRGGH